MCWGILPWGLVYSLLLTAASTASPLAGAVTMFTFVAGTLPAMMGLTAAAPALATFLEDQTVRKIIGFALVVLAIWSLLTTLSMMGDAVHHQH